MPRRISGPLAYPVGSCQHHFTPGVPPSWEPLSGEVIEFICSWLPAGWYWCTQGRWDTSAFGHRVPGEQSSVFQAPIISKRNAPDIPEGIQCYGTNFPGRWDCSSCFPSAAVPLGLNWTSRTEQNYWRFNETKNQTEIIVIGNKVERRKVIVPLDSRGIKTETQARNLVVSKPHQFSILARIRGIVSGQDRFTPSYPTRGILVTPFCWYATAWETRNESRMGVEMFYIFSRMLFCFHSFYHFIFMLGFMAFHVECCLLCISLRFSTALWIKLPWVCIRWHASQQHASLSGLQLWMYCVFDLYVREGDWTLV